MVSGADGGEDAKMATMYVCSDPQITVESETTPSSIPRSLTLVMAANYTAAEVVELQAAIPGYFDSPWQKVADLYIGSRVVGSVSVRWMLDSAYVNGTPLIVIPTPPYTTQPLGSVSSAIGEGCFIGQIAFSLPNDIMPRGGMVTVESISADPELAFTNTYTVGPVGDVIVLWWIAPLLCAGIGIGIVYLLTRK